VKGAGKQLQPAPAKGSAEITAGGAFRGDWETSLRLVDCHPLYGARHL
jgi:hypothetical protein